MTTTNTAARNAIISALNAAKNAPEKRARFGQVVAANRSSRFLRAGERGLFAIQNPHMVKDMLDGMMRFYQRGVLVHEEPSSVSREWFDARFAA